MTIKQITNTALTVLTLGLALTGANAQSVIVPPLVFPNGNTVNTNTALSGAFYIQPGLGGYRASPPLAVGPNGINPNAIYALDGPGIYYDYVLDNGNTAIQYDAYDENANYANTSRQIAYYRPTRVPHDRDHIQAKNLKNGVVQINWKGDPRIVNGITFALFDRKGRVLKQETVTRLPAEARFTRPRNAGFYGAKIYYADGKTNTFMTGM